MSDDPVDGMQVGETQRLSGQFEVDAYEAAWDEFVGFDRDVENIEMQIEMVDDDTGVVTVSGDVTKIDPDVKPVFQSEDQFENGYNHSQRPWWLPYVTGAIATMIAGIVTLGVGVQVTDAAFPEVDLNPMLIAVSELVPVAMLVLIGMAVVGLLTIGPRGSFQ